MTVFYAIIPSRMKSTRLPEKPLKDIAGRPMVVRVAERAKASGAADVVVATDHEDIVKACEANDVKVVLTSPNHPTGTDRLAETVTKLGLADDAIVVNVQGDEPLIPTNVVREVAELLAAHPECEMATAGHPIDNIEEFLNPNVVKVVRDAQGNAITFSRAPIPWPRDAFREMQFRPVRFRMHFRLSGRAEFHLAAGVILHDRAPETVGPEGIDSD